MAVAQRIESLRHQHAELETALHAQESRPWHDEPAIMRLKVDKLRVKDTIARLTMQAQMPRDRARCRSDTG